MILIPVIGYETFSEGKNNLLQKTRVFDVSTEEKLKKALIAVLQELLQSQIEEERLFSPRETPAKPQLPFDATPFEIVQAREVYEAALALAQHKSANDMMAETFLRGDYAHVTREWLETTLSVVGHDEDYEDRFYFIESE